MDPLALVAATSVLACVMAFALALFSNATASRVIRGRLEGVLAGTTSILEGDSVTALRGGPRKIGVIGALVSGSWLKRIEDDLRMADSQLQPSDVLIIRGALAALGFAGPYLFIGGAIGVIGGVVAAFVGLQAPQVWIHRRSQSRKNKLEQQLPEALTFLANSLKAGFGLLQSLNMASEQLAHPIATEFAQTVHETNVGSSTEEAFLGLGERAHSYDMDLVVTAVLIQRSSGGNLAEILETVAATMRERVRIRGEIETLTAQQKLTGVVIGLLPVGVVLMFLVVSPDYILVLFNRPIGQVLLGIAGFMEAIGIMVIRRILDIEV